MVLAIFLCFDIVHEIPVPFLAISNFVCSYFWFYFGYQLYLSRDRIYHIINSHKYLFSTGLLLIFIACTWAKCIYIEDNGIRTWYTELANVAIVMLFWYWVNLLIISAKSNGGGYLQKFNYLNRHAYGIYVFHNWIQPFMISSTAIGLFGLDVLAMKYPILFPLLFFISSFIISFGLTWILLKTRFGRFLIG